MAIMSVAEILKSFESRVGCQITIEPKYQRVGSIRFPAGKIFYFKNTTIDVNNFAAAEIARDKDYARFFMSRFGYNIPEGSSFFSEYWRKINNSTNNSYEAIVFANKLGYPLILKPNGRGQGEGVYKIHSEKQLSKLLPRIFKDNNIILLEKYIEGKDYRIVVLRDEVLIAYSRSPLFILGDGYSSIETLLENKIKNLNNLNRNLTVTISDSRIRERLRNLYKITPRFVPELNEKIILLDNANLSSGGEGEDVSDFIHHSYKELAIKLTRDMGLNFAGVDFITKNDIAEPINLNETFILEINSSPGLAHYQTFGAGAEERVRELYLKILLLLKDDK